MIKSFKVSNFKSIESVEVFFDDVTVLVGTSGAGKSNFLEAICTLRGILQNPDFNSNRQGSFDFRSFLPATTEIEKVPTGHSYSKNNCISFEIEFEIQGMDKPFRYHLAVAPGVTVRERLTVDGNIVFDQGCERETKQGSKWFVKPNVTSPPSLKQGVCIGLIPELHEVVLAYTALTTGIGFYDFPDDVLTSNRLSTAQGLNEDGANYVEVLQRMTTNLRDFLSRSRIVASLKCINPTVSSIEVDDVLKPKNVIVGHKFDGGTLGISLPQESVGFRKFYAHLLALFQEPPKLALLFEHPEDGIHPGAMQLLAEEFKATAKENRGQVILTTHNPGLLDFFDVEAIRVVERDGFNTNIGPVSSEQQEAIKSALMATGELLTTELAVLDSEEACN